MAIKAIAGGINGYLQGNQSNALRNQIIGAYSNLPQAPNLQNAFLNGYSAQLGEAVPAAQQNYALDQAYSPLQMGVAANEYSQYLPQFAGANLAALKEVDPQFLSGYKALGNSVSSNLAAGSSLTPDMQNQLTGDITGAQAARGNVLGNAPVSADALYLGQAGQQLLQQRQGAMESFLNGANPQSQFGALAGTGASALAGGTSAATQPWQYEQAPTNWGPQFENAAQTQWQDTDTNALARARAIASAPAAVNPWLSSLSGASGAIGGGGSSGGNGGSGGMGSLLGLFGGAASGGGGGGGASFSGYSPVGAGMGVY
jgi:hypothetical protein